MTLVSRLSDEGQLDLSGVPRQIVEHFMSALSGYADKMDAEGKWTVGPEEREETIEQLAFAAGDLAVAFREEGSR